VNSHGDSVLNFFMKMSVN